MKRRAYGTKRPPTTDKILFYKNENSQHLRDFACLIALMLIFNPKACFAEKCLLLGFAPMTCLFQKFVQRQKGQMLLYNIPIGPPLFTDC